MGNQCLASTPIEHYQSYFDELKVSEMKDYWTTMEVYKIKKLYDSMATKHPEFSKYTHLEMDNFMQLFPEMQNLPQKQKSRIFQIFNFDGQGIVDWENFYSMISICYFCKEETLSVLMFLIFDEALSKELNRAELELLIEHNMDYVQTSEEEGEQIPNFAQDQIMDRLIGNSSSVKLSQWIEKSEKIYNFLNFRKIFNIFIEEQLEKELIRNFGEWNNLYVEDQDRYVSYLISFKWFESWKLYVKQQYGVLLNNTTKKPTTFKTRKLVSDYGINKKKKLVNALTLRQLKLFQKSKKKVQSDDEETLEDLKNFDFIHGSIGQKPHQINNKVLEGDYEQVLNQDIIENRDYVLISQKVWKTLKRIYDGYPEFRRTGSDFIELYPKILKVLNYRKGMICFDEDNIKQVSAYYSLYDIIDVLFPENSTNKKMYFKTISMSKWQHIQDDETVIGELSNEAIIFLLGVNQGDQAEFQKKYLNKIPTNISEINVGDQIIYTNQKNIDTNMHYLGRNVEGKYVLHPPGQSYLYDICILEKDLLKRGRLLGDEKPTKAVGELDLLKMKKKKDDLGFIGIPNTKGLGYINSTIIHLYYNWAIKSQLSFLYKDEQPNHQQKAMVTTLCTIFKDLTYKRKVNTKLILQTIDEILPDFNHFSSDMCKQFLNQFYQTISNELNERQLKNTISNYQIKTERVLKCMKCQSVVKNQEQKFVLSVPLKTSKQKYYEIIYVPFCQSLKVFDMKRYGFKLKGGATLAQYKKIFETVAQLPPCTKYLLMQVYSNNIVKNYSTAKLDATLEELALRDTDLIFAYELKTDFQEFISKHYTKNYDFENKELKIDQFIDCKNGTRGWIFGKICEKDFSPYGHRTIIRVIHKFSKGEHWEISYDVDEYTVANFPTKSYLNGQQYHLRLLQRYFNEGSNDMEVCNVPLVCVLTNWMRWKQFYYLVYLQMKRFIRDDQSQFDDEEDGGMGIQSSKSLTIKSGRQKKKTHKLRLNKFKDYLHSEQFPYKLYFVDYSGRCAICFKFLKNDVFQGQQSTYCSGCQISPKQPISWQIKVADVMVCVDWKNLNRFNKDIIKDHSSYINMTVDRKKDVQTIENCLDILKNGCSEPLEQLCCNVQTETLVKQNLVKLPQNLTIYIERIVEENGFIKIMNKFVKVQEELVLNGLVYSLVGLTSIDGGSNKSNKFRSFIKLSQTQWLEYDGNVVRSVKKNILDKIMALNLYYKKKDNKNQEDEEKKQSA